MFLARPPEAASGLRFLATGYSEFSEPNKKLQCLGFLSYCFILEVGWQIGGSFHEITTISKL